MSVVKKIYITAKEGKQAELQAELLAMVEPSRNEEGCVSYDLFQIQEDPKTFMFLEVFESEEAFECHRNTEHFLNFKKVAGDFIESKESAVLNMLG